MLLVRLAVAYENWVVWIGCWGCGEVSGFEVTGGDEVLVFESC